MALTALLYATGERPRGRVALRAAARRRARRGATRLAAQAVRAVALGRRHGHDPVGAGGVGFAVVGIPFAAILTAVSFILAVAQIGPIPVLIGAVIWVYSTQARDVGHGISRVGGVLRDVDNIVRPVLIKRGADLPLLLIFAGVIGGLFAFGVVGLFIGPVVLAVAYTLLLEWMEQS